MNFIERIHALQRCWRYRLRHERDSIRYLLNLDLTNKVVLDIGANKGIYSYWLSKKVGKNGHVFAFEPQPELGVYLNDFKNTFGLDNLTVINKGLSTNPGKMDLYRGEVGSGGARLAPETVLNDNEGLEKVEVEIATLDDQFEGEQMDIGFIKCDVEGHELSVFKGGEELIKSSNPVILFECHHEEAKQGTTFEYLKDLGFAGFFIFKNEEIEVTDFDKYPYNKPTDNHRNYIFRRI